MVKHAADDEQPLLTAAERVERAFAGVTSGREFTPEETQWLDRIRAHMVQNLSLEPEDFDLVPVFSREGGLGAVRRVFGDRLEPLIPDLNERIAA